MYTVLSDGVGTSSIEDGNDDDDIYRGCAKLPAVPERNHPIRAPPRFERDAKFGKGRKLSPKAPASAHCQAHARGHKRSTGSKRKVRLWERRVRARAKVKSGDFHTRERKGGGLGGWSGWWQSPCNVVVTRIRVNGTEKSSSVFLRLKIDGHQQGAQTQSRAWFAIILSLRYPCALGFSF